ncbi:uncharacterized protein LOC119662475 [Teleopsis dalmanni]|uniref:uncharacterized protein LOC119662475 n=1 Tax=Teleopsis dalmanni TaxID=139649 RepID=UPI0018CEC536|nr:uncharacterized protein LOC119662475 [Teleopsis dalmanni]
MAVGGRHHTNNDLQLLPDRFNIPLFLLSRHPLKSDRPEVLKNYLQKHCPLYPTSCHLDEDPRTAAKTYVKHVVGLEKSRFDEKCKGQRFATTPRKQTSKDTWHLPPNCYQSEKKKDKPGLGAFWKKLPKNIGLPSYKPPLPKFYDLPSFTDTLQNKSNQQKGVFLSNARNHRPTARSMVMNPLTCYRNPKDPGPANYTPYKETYKCAPTHKTKESNQFYSSTTVPIKDMSTHLKNGSFTPAPGRYDNRFRDICGCSPKLTYWPDMQTEIDKQKRKKFRLQPFTKIKVKNFYTPEWRHVKGNGFQHLFKTAGKKTSPKNLAKALKQKKGYKRVQMHPDARYFKMINTPHRYMDSTFRTTIPHLQRPMQFNCMVKRVIRKQLRNNKKIAFGSSSDRFKDTERTTHTITPAQLETLRNTLPPERQFRDYPVMRVNPEEIVSDLFKVPAHYKPVSVVKEAKRQFKFANLPEPKILVTEKDTHVISSAGDVIECKGLFTDNIDPRKFFRDNIEEELLHQYELCVKI